MIKDIEPYRCKPGDDPRIDAARWMLDHHRAYEKKCRQHEKWAIVEAVGIMCGSILAGLFAGVLLRGLVLR